MRFGTPAGFDDDVRSCVSVGAGDVPDGPSLPCGPASTVSSLQGGANGDPQLRLLWIAEVDHQLGLEQADLETDSAYNTYLYPGIPPGPIANPGIAAIEAVIHPADTEFIFFVAAPECDGSHQFAATLAGHNANVEAFRASGCGE